MDDSQMNAFPGYNTSHPVSKYVQSKSYESLRDPNVTDQERTNTIQYYSVP